MEKCWPWQHHSFPSEFTFETSTRCWVESEVTRTLDVKIRVKVLNMATIYGGGSKAHSPWKLTIVPAKGLKCAKLGGQVMTRWKICQKLWTNIKSDAGSDPPILQLGPRNHCTMYLYNVLCLWQHLSFRIEGYWWGALPFEYKISIAGGIERLTAWFVAPSPSDGDVIETNTAREEQPTCQENIILYHQKIFLNLWQECLLSWDVCSTL